MAMEAASASNLGDRTRTGRHDGAMATALSVSAVRARKPITSGAIGRFIGGESFKVSNDRLLSLSEFF
jgi:hypothetical protein